MTFLRRSLNVATRVQRSIVTYYKADFRRIHRKRSSEVQRVQPVLAFKVASHCHVSIPRNMRKTDVVGK